MENSEQQAFANEYHCGLNKREYFAGLAMQGLLANNPSFLHGNREGEYADMAIAVEAVRHADELLKQLEE